MSDDINFEEKYATQTKALLMIQVMGQTSVNFLNCKKMKKEMIGHLATFELAEEELLEFAEFFIDSSMKSKAYKTAVFGTIPMSDAGAATRLAENIDEITRKIPTKFGLEQESRPLRDAFFKVYKKQIKNAEAIMRELGIEI